MASEAKTDNGQQETKKDGGGDVENATQTKIQTKPANHLAITRERR